LAFRSPDGDHARLDIFRQRFYERVLGICVNDDSDGAAMLDDVGSLARMQLHVHRDRDDAGVE
jgi:hypothetical protein